jgi:hypothetical protein
LLLLDAATGHCGSASEGIRGGLMESNKFDALARRAVGEDSSRRGVLRSGLSALGATALAVVGLSAADDAAAKNNNNNNNNQQQRRRRRRNGTVAICANGQTQSTTRGAFNAGAFPGATLGPCVCANPNPITCGTGCCSNEFPQCCGSGQALGGPGGNQGTVCAPNTSRCCPVNQGGGACDSPTPQCCPPTNQNPRGSCAPVDANCCNNQAGGGFCQAPFNQCCPVTSQFPGGACCRPNQRCGVGAVGTQGNCPPGLVINFRGCCSSAVDVEGGEDGGVRGYAAKVGIRPV